MDQKIKLQTLVQIFTNTDGFYTFYISQGSVATQLRCGGMFSNHKFFTEYKGEKILKIGHYLAKIWTKLCGLLFGGHPVYAILIILIL